MSEVDNAIGDEIIEAKMITKVNSKGKKTRRKKCPKGYKLVNGQCKRISGSEKVTKKKAMRKAVKTRKRKGSGAKRRTKKKRLRALKKRRSMGL